MPATSRRLAACSSRCLLAVTLALLSGGFQFAVAFRVDFLLTPRQHILRRDVADGTAQADVVVMLDVSLHQAQRIVQRERCSGPDTLALLRLVPTLDFPIRLGIVVRTYVMPEMRMNSLKSRAMNCGPLPEMIRGFATGYFSLGIRRQDTYSHSE